MSELKILQDAIERDGGGYATVHLNDGQTMDGVVWEVLASIAEYERKMIAKRTKWSMLQHQRNGRKMGRYAPYGWEIDPADASRLRKVEAEQAAIERIAELHKAGLNDYQIAKTLNEEFVESARAGKWNPKTIGKIIDRIQSDVGGRKTIKDA